VYGLGGVGAMYDPSTEDVFTVEFTRQGDWGLFHAGRRLMHVHFGQASLGPEGFPAERFRADLPRVITSLAPGELDHLCELARTFAEQPHGCLLVISTSAAKEAERLSTQCTRVDPFPLTALVIPLVTAIDGAVLIDPAGVCHAIGVILDGEASPKCSPERGARYNSAVRYTEWRGTRWL
jgi:DisA bacterial checkpoint controller nucleotide-binding